MFSKDITFTTSSLEQESLIDLITIYNGSSGEFMSKSERGCKEIL